MTAADEAPFEHLIDAGSLKRAKDDLRTRDPLSFPGYAELIATEADDAGTDEAVVRGTATIGGHDVEVAGFSFRYFGGSMGEVAGERLARALEGAAERGVPFVLRTASGGARMQEGMNALVQMPKVVAARLALAEAHVPFIAVLGDPTTGGVLASIAALADYTIAESVATIGFAGPRVVEMITGSAPGAGSHTAAAALGNGLVDVVVDNEEIGEAVARVLNVLAADTPDNVEAPASLDPTDARDGWAAVEAARSKDRTDAPTLLRGMCPDGVDLNGDRSGSDNPALLVSLGRLRGRRVLAMALDRRQAPGPGAYRLARRSLRIAERLQIPVVVLIDTRGADPSEISEAGGIAWEISQLFAAMLVTEVPIASVVTGEGGSGGALAFAVGDVLLAYEDSVFSVIGPEGAATILWRDKARAPEAARALRLTARDLMEFGIADALLPEPPGAESLARALAYHLDRVPWTSGHDLVTARLKKWRRGGNG